MFIEIFECRNCFHAGPLTVHGRCKRCDSDSVISQEVIAVMLAKELGTFKDFAPMMPAGHA